MMSGMGLRDAARATARDWADEANRLDQWATEQELELGGREIMITAHARFRAVVLRLGAAMLGAKP